MMGEMRQDTGAFIGNIGLGHIPEFDDPAILDAFENIERVLAGSESQLERFTKALLRALRGRR